MKVVIGPDIGPEDAVWSREADKRVRREDLLRLGIEPTDPDNPWEFVEEGQTFRCKRRASWERFVRHVKCVRVSVFTDNDYVTFTAIAMFGTKATYSAAIPNLKDHADHLADLLCTYPTRRSAYRRLAASRMVRTLLLDGERARELDEFLKKQEQTQRIHGKEG